MPSFLENLVEFFYSYRIAGGAAGISEVLDAIRALRYIDLTDKAQVRTALLACLAKTWREQMLCGRVFDLYFQDKKEKTEQWESRKALAKQRESSLEQEASSLQFLDAPLELTEELKEVYSALPDVEKQVVKDYLNKTNQAKNMRENMRHAITRIIQGKLSRMQQQQQQNPDKGTGMQKAALDSEAGMIAADARQTVTSDENLLQQPLMQIESRDIPRVIRLIREITKEIIGRSNRKYQQAHKGYRLDFKRTLRAGAQTGFVPFYLYYRKKKPDKRKVILVADISSSMHRYSGFVLLFMEHMQSAFAVTDNYVFTTECHLLDRRQGHLIVNGQALDRITGRGGTNLNSAL
ncbi:MAG TPA: hypothetical protein DD727_08050, partial [Clostridiales bacterium]|nr:hypothetical protein [Clostridiales bacterium]